MEEVCERENLKEALRRVRSNKGSAGVDGMTVDGLTDYLRQHWPTIREQRLMGIYEPQPVRRVEIAKPEGRDAPVGHSDRAGSIRPAGGDAGPAEAMGPDVSEHSYGFRPGRSAHQAVAQAQAYINGGHCGVVDLDLDKFFDQVNHDKLMGQIAKRVGDKRLWRLIRAFLNAGDGEWVGQPQHGRDSARGTTFALAKQPRTGRTRPGAHGPGTLLCPLRG
jgi:RNA-directed DNA polymerase